MRSKCVLLTVLTVAASSAAPHKITHAMERTASNGVRYKEVLAPAFRYRGHAAHLLQTGTAKPMGIAAGDFNGDHIQDLAAIYDAAGQSVLAIYRGSNESMFDETPVTIPLPAPANRIVAGDFNGDGLADLVVASTGSSVMYFLQSQGGGTFAEPRPIELESPLTALAVDDVNRRDSVLDILVSTSGASGGMLYLFSHPSGAMSAKPEMVRLPFGQPDQIRVADVDGDGLFDVVVHEGARRAVIAGREHGKPAAVKTLPDAASEPLAGDAMLVPMQFAGVPGITYAGFVDAKVTPQIIRATGGVTFTVTSSLDLGDPNVGAVNDDLVCNSYPTNSQGVPVGGCTYRSAIQNLNSLNVPGTILFAVSTVNLTSGAEIAYVPLTIDGSQTAGGFVTINCTALGGGTIYDPIGVHMQGGNRAGTQPNDPINARLVKGLHIAGCFTGIRLVQGGVPATPVLSNAVVQQNQVLGTTVPIKSGYGIMFQGDVTVGDANPALGNLVDGAGLGILAHYSTGGKVIGNRVVHAADGISSFYSTGVRIGGTNPGEGNLVDISATENFGLFDMAGGNLLGRGYGISVFDGSVGPTQALIQGNYVGTDGTNVLTSKGLGIVVYGSQSTIGGAVAAARNVVAGIAATTTANGFPLAGGILVNGFSNLIQGNYVGIDSTGMKAIANAGVGITQENGSQNQFLGNVIGGMGAQGMFLAGTSKGGVVQGNKIGTNKLGTAALPNASDGIVMQLSFDTSLTQIGGESAGQGNQLSGNAGAGVGGGFDGTAIKGNIIGLDATATYAIPNAYGIFGSGVGNPVIGGTTAAAANIIAGNTNDGVVIDSCCAGSTLQGNIIGTNTAEASGLGNGGNGVNIHCCYNLVLGNTIRNNAGAGIKSDGPQQLRTNSIFNNGGLGIQYLNPPFTPPSITSASSAGATTLISGSVTDALNSIEVEIFASPACDASGFGEGKTYLGKTTLNGLNFSFSAPVQLPAGMFATATTVNKGNFTTTSSFSNCMAITVPPNCASDVTSQVAVTRGGFRLNRANGHYLQTIRITNNGAALSAPLALAFDSMANGVTLFQPAGTTSCAAPASPYLQLPAGLAQGAFVDINAEFVNPTNVAIQYALRLLSGANR